MRYTNNIVGELDWDSYTWFCTCTDNDTDGLGMCLQCYRITEDACLSRLPNPQH